MANQAGAVIPNQFGTVSANQAGAVIPNQFGTVSANQPGPVDDNRPLIIGNAFKKLKLKKLNKKGFSIIRKKYSRYDYYD